MCHPAIHSQGQYNQALEYLSLAWNGLDDQGGKHVGEMLRFNTKLLELDLSSTRAGSEACMVISEGEVEA